MTLEVVTQNTASNGVASLADVRVGVIGDFALDVYFELNKNSGEVSIETNKPVYYGAALNSRLGAASNVVNNLHGLGIKQITVFGATGDDMLGHELLRKFSAMGVNTEHFNVSAQLSSCAYVKPFVEGGEASRIDFGTDAGPVAELKGRVLQALSEQAAQLDVVIINQQFIHPLLDAKMLERLSSVIAANPDCQFYADIRRSGDVLKGATLKVNASEAAQLLALDSYDENDSALCSEQARQLSAKIGSPVLLTRGENGLLYCNADTINSVPGIYLTGELDTVGAGDSVISAFASSLATGMPIAEALPIANAAAAVTVQKLRQTGTASPEEITKVLSGCAYNCNLDLAADVRKARYLNGSDIELVEDLPNNLNIKNAIVDHDGTISTLREGWEAVMLPVMMHSICGDKLGGLPVELVNKLTEKCRNFIDQTTGIQTIVQMQGLRDMVLEEGYITTDKVKSAADYKAIYLEELMASVRDRMARLQRGERGVPEFTLLGAPALLDALVARNVTLYMASGTDEDDVKIEAEALGYADRFKGGIHGSKGNEIGDAKKIVIGRITKEGDCRGDNLVVIGDGPVEILEGRRVGAFCIGIASDEVRRHGMDYSKRSRLIKAGAHIIVPDFSQLELLLKLLFVE